ncbi:ATP-binding protein [Epibacterium ulvae]|uniref:ATP-binding protein n=1 Tax=Epibacterium ulvae TaxID=1156985 RepID=UPI00249133B1|nr:ATP-binding protein [Epibacterium ulvae]
MKKLIWIGIFLSAYSLGLALVINSMQRVSKQEAAITEMLWRSMSAMAVKGRYNAECQLGPIESSELRHELELLVDAGTTYGAMTEDQANRFQELSSHEPLNYCLISDEISQINASIITRTHLQAARSRFQTHLLLSGLFAFVLISSLMWASGENTRTMREVVRKREALFHLFRHAVGTRVAIINHFGSKVSNDALRTAISDTVTELRRITDRVEFSSEPKPVGVIPELIKASIATGMRVKVSKGTNATIPIVLIDPELFEFMLLELLRNSKEAGASAVRVQIAYDHQCLSLRLQDDGPGFPEGYKITPLLSHKKGTSTGMGLYSIHSMLEVIGGSIALSNGTAGGAAIAVKVPVSGTVDEEPDIKDLLSSVLRESDPEKRSVLLLRLAEIDALTALAASRARLSRRLARCRYH